MSEAALYPENTLQIRKVGAACGAEIEGVDLSQPSTTQHSQPSRPPSSNTK